MQPEQHPSHSHDFVLPIKRNFFKARRTVVLMRNWSNNAEQAVLNTSTQAFNVHAKVLCWSRIEAGAAYIQLIW
jgi:hypothetical protein